MTALTPEQRARLVEVMAEALSEFLDAIPPADGHRLSIIDTLVDLNAVSSETIDAAERAGFRLVVGEKT